jgi:hypothetical protein
MPVRSLSRALKSGAAAGALTLAVSGTALAIPAVPDAGMPGFNVSGNVTNASGNVTTGTDVAAPDQQNPLPVQVKPVPQQAPTWPVNAQVLHRPVAASTPSASDDFQWDDAGIGAGGALVVVLAGLGGVMALRRRHVADPPLAA